MYSTYGQYQERGGQMTESEYLVNAQKASELIDYLTMGQAASAECMKPQLSACECDLADRMETVRIISSGLKSENNDGFSQTFASVVEMKDAIRDILRRHLSFPTNLLSFSGHAFV